MVLSWHDNVVTAAAVIMAWSGVVCRELTYAHASASSEWETSAGKQLEEYEEQEECDHCDGKQTTATIILEQYRTYTQILRNDSDDIMKHKLFSNELFKPM